MPSKMVTDRLKTARALQAAAVEHSVGVAASFGARGAAASKDLVSAGLASLFLEVGERLGARAEALVRVDAANLQALHQGASLRARRDKLSKALSQSLSDTRKAVDGVFGAGTSVLVLCLEGRVGQDPVVLHLKARATLERLESGALDSLNPRLQGVAFTTAQLLAPLRGTTEELGRVLLELAATRRLSEARRAEKVAALEAFDQEAKWAARFLEGAFGLAGQQALAGRVRQASRRRRAEEAVVETPEGEAALPLVAGSASPSPVETKPGHSPIHQEVAPLLAFGYPRGDELPPGKPQQAMAADETVKGLISDEGSGFSD